MRKLGSIETLKNDFISSVSYEIKTPLSVIHSYAMALQKMELSPKLQQEYTKTIILASRKLTTLVINIIKLNKLDNKDVNHVAEPWWVWFHIG
ncbi:K+-sensing histidine kinase KdpD [Paenibacillus anaericanus]|uniref:histidine kinase dimerization/phospho-acceptor domain-containing protein n=1 Tax=Paenibacillus anaericanus TaxID=170367 RepID=UPI0027803CB6|nr:histidine kinase dimerization/phospho-acceptor domain-containing protein [Paenibacillus anaericanus]MDQ0088828.1 K+-sensing histidine kinase KdpD [Paenibacillus anaericanus]